MACTNRDAIDAIARWFYLDRLPPDAQVTVWHSDIRCETHIQIGQVVGREVQVMERVVSDEELLRTPNDRIAWRREWFRNPPPVDIQCNCPTCRQWRGEHEPTSETDEHIQEQEARDRARSLLLSCLSPPQRKEFKAKEAFTVVAKSGRRYRIAPGFNYNIVVLNDRGRAIGRLCAGPDEDVPVYDSMLSQKLWLENDEEGFLRVANRDGLMDDIPVYFGDRVALWRG